MKLVNLRTATALLAFGTALTLVPAAQAGPVTDGGIFLPGGCVDSDGSCNVVQGSAVGGNPNFNWLSVSGNALPSQGTGFDISAGGSATGYSFPGDSIEISWDFLVNNTGEGTGTLTWAIQFTAGGNGTNFFTFGTGALTAAYGTEVQGNVMITNRSGVPMPLGYYNLDFQGGGSDTNYEVVIPAGSSIDINPGAPEPASFVLAGGVITGLALLRRRKRLN